jgi:16S rRNA (cytosine1402-N4)-methyltransferase
MHTPVLTSEVIDNLKIKSNGIYLDATVGGGGHSRVIAEKLSRDGVLICIDRDEFALNLARMNLAEFNNKIIFCHRNFCDIKALLCQLNFDKLDGILFDLGVSSMQIDDCNRGFSYMHDGILDMRMNQQQKLSAFDVINNFTKKKLSNIIKNYGEERFHDQIANQIVLERNINCIKTTHEFVRVIRKAIPKKFLYNTKHPEKKTFQAIRIFVNDELNILENTIKDASNVLNKNGRLCVISFHSLEDRIVKNTFKHLSSSCDCPDFFPICTCNKKKKYEVVTKNVICPSSDEIIKNKRSHSARLRVLRKI